MQQKATAAPRSDYQVYDLDANGTVINIGPRMRKKLDAIPLPDLTGKSVLDVGCDFAFWSFLAANKGASYVLGLDRNRHVKGFGHTDLVAENNKIAGLHKGLSACHFEEINLGKQWKEHGHFDVIFCFSMYHHFFECCGDHGAIWFWMWRHLSKGGRVIWENPVDTRDAVSCGNISHEKHDKYNKEAIFDAASRYFDVEHVGPALHEPHREVYICTRREIEPCRIPGLLCGGAHGATAAFEYGHGRRINEINKALGHKPFPGSLNIKLQEPFDWNRGYYRFQMLDVKDRQKGLESEWGHRWVRMYPVQVAGVEGHVMRFEGERYPENFIEVISPVRMRDFISDDMALVSC